mmetsp:Transcript_786/g.828  ORF Transcript_786/g.828 Transcript_786/m.828 type:complete len:233 (+) Transcript_786:47-745(+)
MSLAPYSYFCRTVLRSGSSNGTLKERVKTVRTITTVTTIASLSYPITSRINANTNSNENKRYFSDVTAAAAVVKKPSAGRCNSSSDDDTTANGNVDLSSPKVQVLYNRVVKLPEEEVNILGALVLQLLGRTIFPGQFGTPGGGIGNGDAGAGEEAEAVEEEQTAFDVKLVGFEKKSKIKVIKEVRAIAGLGLKEAKELVDSAPKVILKSLKRDQADELKAKLESLGAQIEIV